METEIIRYNLTERGRKFRGVERNFDIPVIVRAINSGVTQEKVKHRDMLGYFGHWPRVKFGMNPAEGGIADGRAVSVEPALVTTYLKAYDDGTIEHRAEFIETTGAGRLAMALYKGKLGGFSSAIDENRPEFFGFDYVNEPNYTTNRGYEVALDSAGMTLDDVVVREYNQQFMGVLGLLDSLNGEHAKALSERRRLAHELRLAHEAMAHMKDENDEYIAMLARGGKGNVLDSLEAIMPLTIDPRSAQARRAEIASFHKAELANIDIPVEKPSPAQQENERLVGRFLR